MNENYLKDLFIDEVKGSLKGGSGGGGVTSWNDLEDRPFGIGETLHLQSEFILNADSPSCSFYPVGVLVNRRKRWNDGDELVFIIDDTAELRVPQSGTEPTTGGSVVYDDVKFRISEFKLARVNAGTLWSAVFTATDLTGAGLSKSYTVDARYVTSKINTLDPQFLPEEARSDWNQVDATAFDYVKNRPMYYERMEQTDVVIYDKTYTVDELSLDGLGYASIQANNTLVSTPSLANDDWVYTAVVDGVTYENLRPHAENGYGGSALGSVDFSEYPFFTHFAGGVYNCVFATHEAHTIKLTAYIPEIVSPLDEKWLPESVAKTTLRSTTEESTKKFDVTVDDEGNLSTTDVETGETKVIGSGSGGGGVTNWNDLEDKPFGEAPGLETIYKADVDMTESSEVDDCYDITLGEFGIESEISLYFVKFDGVDYQLTPYIDSKYGDICIGNEGYYPCLLEEEGIPFVIYSYGGYSYLRIRDKNTHSLEITVESIVVHKLDSKYLPDYIYGMTPKVYKGVILERDFTAEELAPYSSEDNVYSYGVSNITDYSIWLSDKYWYEVLIDGVAYDVPGVHSYYYYVGVSSLRTSQEYPFSIWSTSYGYSFEFTTPGPHSVKITEIELPQVKLIEAKFIPKESRANWNESDGTSINYIENRPFYEEFILGDVVYHDTMYASPENKNDDWDTGYYYNTDNIGFDEPLNIEVGRKYSVRVDGVQYILTSQISPSNAPFIDLVGCYDDGRIEPNYEKSNAPVAVRYYPEEESLYAYFYFKEPGNHEVEIRVVEDSIIHKIEDKYLTQPDWNEEDINSAAYVHNKTHYVEHYYETIFEEATIVSNGQAHSNSQTPAYQYYYVNNTCFMNGDTPMFRVEAGKTYKVTFNGKEYVLVAKPRGSSGAFIGNSWSVNVEGEATDTDVLFTIEDDGTPSWNLFSMGEHSVKIEIQRSIVHTLDPKYLPMDDIATAVLSALPTWTGGSY